MKPTMIPTSLTHYVNIKMIWAVWRYNGKLFVSNGDDDGVVEVNELYEGALLTQLGIQAKSKIYEPNP